MRKSWIVLAILAMFLPVLLMGCEGDDGAAGAAGAPGAPGDPGTPGTPGPGASANETCVICHGPDKLADLVAAHAKPAGTVESQITAAAFPEGGNASVTFNFVVRDAAGNIVPVDLTEAAGANLRYQRFTIARLVPGTNGDPDSWFFYGVRSHQQLSGLVNNGDGTYTFTFDNTVVLDAADASLTHRVGFELNITNFPAALRLTSVNPTFDFLPNGTPVTPQREVVTTAACNECHDPLVFHGGRRVETKFCVMCHNYNNDLIDGPVNYGPIPFTRLVHAIHTAQDLQLTGIGGTTGENIGDFTEVTYPILFSPLVSERLGVRNVRNCTKCHQGGADSDNWNTRPSMEACGSCHVNVNFAAGHVEGLIPQTDNSGCAVSFCHGSPSLQPSFVHRTENVTPNNPELPAGLDQFEYFIDDVTVDNNVAVVTFRITRNGTPIDLTVQPPGTTGGPGFLLAWALPQDNVASPADYNNLESPQPPPPTSATGNGAGQPPTVSLASVRSTLTGTPAAFTARLESAPFPAGAKMRAVALQGYFSQDVNNTPAVTNDDVGRHTPSVQRAVTGDAVRRTVVKSGYVDGKPVGCLECHEIFEGHGGSRVNNVQVCVMCHNPNLSSSGRTVDPATANPDTVAALGPDPLEWPEATNNMRSLIHGIHAAPIRDNPFEFVRNRSNGLYYNWSEVTYPGTLNHCQKCHDGVTYDADLPAGQLLSTERITTGNDDETRADIIAARAGMPNDTDLVNSPTVAACFYCHDSSAAASHFVLNGGKIRSTRVDARVTPLVTP